MGSRRFQWRHLVVVALATAVMACGSGGDVRVGADDQDRMHVPGGPDGLVGWPDDMYYATSTVLGGRAWVVTQVESSEEDAPGEDFVLWRVDDDGSSVSMADLSDLERPPRLWIADEALFVFVKRCLEGRDCDVSNEGVVWVFGADGSVLAEGVALGTAGSPFGDRDGSVWIDAHPEVVRVDRSGAVVERVPLEGTAPCLFDGELFSVDGSDRFPLVGGSGDELGPPRTWPVLRWDGAGWVAHGDPLVVAPTEDARCHRRGVETSAIRAMGVPARYWTPDGGEVTVPQPETLPDGADQEMVTMSDGRLRAVGQGRTVVVREEGTAAFSEIEVPRRDDGRIERLYSYDTDGETAIVCGLRTDNRSPLECQVIAP